MPIDTLPAKAASPPPRPRSRWTPVEQLRLFGRELGRADVIGIHHEWRPTVGRVHEWDDRSETSLYALYRRLQRRAHGEGSARFAIAQQQLIDSPLAAAFGWHRRYERGKMRYFERDGRTELTATPTMSASERFFRAHRRDLLRRLDVLQAMGLIKHWPERDYAGRWYRTVIELVDIAPITDRALLRKVRKRMKGFRQRRKRHLQRTRHNAAGELQPPTTPRLTRLLTRAQRPGKATRRRLELGRRQQRRDRDRAREVEHALMLVEQARVVAEAECITAAAAAADTDRDRLSGDITHPYGAGPPEGDQKSPPLESSLHKATTAPSSPPPVMSSFELFAEIRNFAEKSAAMGLDGEKLASTVAAFRAKLFASERRRGSQVVAQLVSEQRRRGVVQAPWRDDAGLRDCFGLQYARRGLMVRASTAGQSFPHSVRVDAWAVHRHGLDELLVDATLDPRRDHGTRSIRTSRLLDAAIARYDLYVDQRPPRWPSSGVAALTVIACDRRPCDFAQDVRRLDQLSRRMQAQALADDVQRLRRRRDRALARIGAAGGADPQIVAVLAAGDRLAERMAAWVQRRRAAGADYEDLRRQLGDHLLMLDQHPGKSAGALAYVKACEERLYAHRYQHERAGTWDDRRPRREAYSPDAATQLSWTYGSEVAAGVWDLPSRWLTIGDALAAAAR